MRTEEATPMNFIDHLRLDFPEGHEGQFSHAFAVQDIHLNSMGVLHGGMCSTIIDMAIARAIRSAVPSGMDIMTIALNVDFIGGCGEGVVTVTGRAVRVGKRLANGEAEIRFGERLITRGSGTWFVTERRAA